MPSVLKQNGFLYSQDSVKIPESPVFIQQQEESSEESEEEFQDQSTDESQGESEEETQSTGVADEGSIEEENPQYQLADEEKPAGKSFTPDFMTRSELSDYYKNDLDEIRRAVAEQGYGDAVTKRRGELTECIRSVEVQLAEIQKVHDSFLTKYAVELKFLAIDIAEKMISHKIDEEDETLKKLVMQTIGSVKNSGWLDVEVSENLVNLVDVLRKELCSDTTNGRITVSPKACASDTCRVNAEEGTLVSSISVQADNLRELFHKSDREKR